MLMWPKIIKKQPKRVLQPLPKLKYAFAVTLNVSKTLAGRRAAAGGYATKIHFAVTKVSPMHHRMKGRVWSGPVRPTGPGTMLVQGWTSGPLGVGWGPIRILKPQMGKETQNGLPS